MRRLGIDIGGTKTLCVVVDGVGGDTRVVEERRVATDATGDAVAAVVGLARGFENVASLGLGIAALVTRDGTAVTTTHLPGVRDVPLRAVLSEQLGFNLTQSLSDCYEMIDMGYPDRAKTWLNYIGWLFVGSQIDEVNLKELIDEMVVEEATLDLDSRLAALFDEKS